MARSATATLHPSTRAAELAAQFAVVISASLFVALCARVTLPLPWTPVPLSLASFAVLLVGLVLGPARGAAALALYLAQGAAGLPVFTPGPGGLAQLFGPTGGYLVAYPAAAFVAGMLSRRPPARVASRSFSAGVLAAIAAEAVLFASGLAWLLLWTGQSFAAALALGLTPFLFGEVMKVMAAAALAARWHRFSSH